MRMSSSSWRISIDAATVVALSLESIDLHISPEVQWMRAPVVPSVGGIDPHESPEIHRIPGLDGLSRYGEGLPVGPPLLTSLARPPGAAHARC